MGWCLKWFNGNIDKIYKFLHNFMNMRCTSKYKKMLLQDPSMQEYPRSLHNIWSVYHTIDTIQRINSDNLDKNLLTEKIKN